MSTTPNDATILNNMVNIFDQLLKDIRKYGANGQTRHDGPVLYVGKGTNVEHLIHMADHFVKVWKRAASKNPT